MLHLFVWMRLVISLQLSRLQSVLLGLAGSISTPPHTVRPGLRMSKSACELNTKSKISKYRLGALVPALIVALVGALYWFAGGFFSVGSDTNASREVVVGGDYYVSVVLIELESLDINGDAWDTHNNSGPDVYVDIIWRGQRIYRSTTKDDTLIAKWSNAELDLRSMTLSGEAASLDSVIKAARINVQPDEKLMIKVFDADLVGSDDIAGSLELRTIDLKLGDTTYHPLGMKRVVLRIVDMSEAPDILR